MIYMLAPQSQLFAIPDEQVDEYESLGYQKASDEDVATWRLHHDVYGGLQGTPTPPPLNSDLGHHAKPLPTRAAVKREAKGPLTGQDKANIADNKDRK